MTFKLNPRPTIHINEPNSLPPGAYIVKVQIPVYVSSEDPPPEMMMVYNRTRSVYAMLPLQNRFVRELVETFKGFYEMVINEDGSYTFGAAVKDPGW